MSFLIAASLALSLSGYLWFEPGPLSTSVMVLLTSGVAVAALVQFAYVERDLKSITRFIAGWTSTMHSVPQTGHRPQVARPQFLSGGRSAWGRRLINQMRPLIIHMEALSEQLRQQKEQPLPSKTEARSFDGTERSVNDLAQKYANLLQEKLRAVSGAAVVPDESGTCVHITGIRGSRVRALITSMCESGWLGGETMLAPVAYRDQLLFLGIGYVLRADFETQGGCGSLLASYASGIFPTEIEQRAISAAAQNLRMELLHQGAVSSLVTQVKEEEQRNEEKAEFLKHMSHDIRSPLNNIKAVLHCLDHEAYTSKSEASELIKSALVNCDSAAELVEGVMDYAMYRAGRLMARSEKVSLSALVDDAAASFRTAARLKNLNLDVRGDDLVIAQCDRRQVKRIINNLLSNAIKYTPTGGIEIALESDPVVQRAFLRVKDTGRGMSEEQLVHLFEPFSRFADQEIEGVGLGLTVTKILAESNNGKISVISQLGYGSTFTFELPYLEILPKVELFEETPQPSNARRVLVVDDDVDSVETLSRLLINQSFIVVSAFTVDDAILHLQNEHFDTLVTDLEMPFGGGRRILEEARKCKFAGKTVVLSGASLVNEKEFTVPVTAHLLKPVDIAELVQLLR